MSCRFRLTEPRVCAFEGGTFHQDEAFPIMKRGEGTSPKGQENHPKRTLTSRFLAALLFSNANSRAMSSMAFFEDASGKRAKMAVNWAAGPEGRMAGSGSSGASSFATGSLQRGEEEGQLCACESKDGSRLSGKDCGREDELTRSLPRHQLLSNFQTAALLSRSTA